MRVLEHRRHSVRDAAEDALSPVGRALARRVGATIGPFDRVVTSPKGRAVETALALAGHIEARRAELGRLPDEALARVEEASPRSFGEYVRLARASPIVGEVARRQAALWVEELERVPDGGQLLLISHAGVIELGTAGAVPEPAEAFGAPLLPLEGVRVTWERGRWTRAEVVRVSAGTTGPVRR